jgi:riboflavin biosynthesis pyrimidine reductase
MTTPTTPATAATPPDRTTGRGLALEPLWARRSPGDGDAAGERRGGDLPPALAARYGRSLAIPLRSDRPTIVANFVESLDGVVALNEPGTPTGGGEISGFFEPDRFVMGLLRAIADAVVVGAGTVRNAPTHEWTPRRVDRAHATDYESWRRQLGLAPQPTTVIVTATGDLDAGHPALAADDVPVIVLTTERGGRYLAGLQLPAHVRVETIAHAERVTPDAILAVLRREGAQLALCEGGPHLLGDLLSADLIDELFLTIAPQIIGRARDRQRFAFVEGYTYGAEAGRWARLVSVHRAGDHLFLRHRLGEP